MDRIKISIQMAKCKICSEEKILYKDKVYCYECYKKDAQIRQLKIRNRNRYFVYRFLKIFGQCIDCGNKDWRVLEFDHKNRNNKKDTVSSLMNKHIAIFNLKSEMKKCEIRCANCHKIKTRNQLNWFNFD